MPYYLHLKILLTGIVLLFCPMVLFAQLISGKVFKAGTDTVVIAQASVYYGGTQTGTITNADGLFEIQTLPGKIPLVISCVGYYSVILNDYDAVTPLKVYLKPKINELHDVTISGSGMPRAEMERMFIREFIGVSDNAQSCRIINLDDIDLHYYTKTSTLTAFCDNPIEIENRRLGYHITYYLDKFTMDAKNTLYQGNYVFTDKISASGNPKKILRFREEAYHGSRMEFIRALWHNKLADYGYQIVEHLSKPVDIDSIIVSDKLAQKYVILSHWVTILPVHDVFKMSRLTANEPRSFIDQSGFYGTGLKWFGYMSRQRIGDLLPFEYHSPAELKQKQ